MSKFTKAIGIYGNTSDAHQKAAGKALAGAMDTELEELMLALVKLTESGAIDPRNPKSLLNMSVYEKMTEQEQDYIDVSLMNIANMVDVIVDFYKSKDTPNSSPHLETMLQNLLQMRKRLEAKHDVLKF